MPNPTDTNQASEDELEQKVDIILLAGWRYGKQKEEVLNLIRTEKLKLLAEVREQQIPVIALKAKKPHDEVQIQAVPIESLTKLEAEL